MTPPVHTDRSGLSAVEMDDLIATAGRAPSLHNSQPWRFRLTADALELRIDPQRALKVCDPQARGLVVSCGAALHNLQLGLRGKSLTAQVDLTPDSTDPLLLARVRALPGPDPTPEEHQLLAAVVRRHTHRHGFSGEPLAGTLVSALEAAVAGNGARLHWVEDRAQIAVLSALARDADDLQLANAEWQAEVGSWVTSEGQDRRDGIPLTALPPAPRQRDHAGLPGRSFVTGRAAPTAGTRPGKAGRIAVIVTDDDQVVDWLAAGQALQRLLLRAAAHWAFATYATMPLEVPHLRQSLRDQLQLSGHPQMVLELGHAGIAHVTPRRPADQVWDR